MALVSFAEMQDVIASAFLNAGMAEQEAQQCARIHTESTLDGVNSHGLNRVARFVDFVSKGWVNLAAKPKLVKQLGAIEIYDGGRAPGVLNAIFSTDRAMQMAAQHAFDLRMAADNLGELRRIVQRVTVHMLDAGGKRRVMHHHQRRLGRRVRQRPFEPIEPLGAEEAAMFSRDMRIERDEA